MTCLKMTIPEKLGEMLIPEEQNFFFVFWTAILNYFSVGGTQKRMRTCENPHRPMVEKHGWSEACSTYQ